MHAPARALSLADLTNAEAGRGLKLALEKGAVSAVDVLGKLDGFLGNPKVRIPLPPFLEQAAGLLRTLGQGGRVDEIITSINRAAEAAVPQAKDLLVNAVKGISVQDAKNILSGGDNSVTQFFAEKTRAPLQGRFLPVVTQATERVGLLAQYNDVAGKAAGMGLLKPEESNIQQYVTGKALDGLYLMIGEKEREIRRDPVGTGSAVLQKVFGAIR
ncbi:MAG: hypothetical protein RLZZ126_1843 [Pseudomonadota bacterium]|jgi:hypothetical protein